MLKGPVLYTENEGIFQLRDYKLNGNKLKFNKIKSTINNELLNLLNQNKEIEIIGNNEIKIKNNVLKEAGFMLFI